MSLIQHKQFDRFNNVTFQSQTITRFTDHVLVTSDANLGIDTPDGIIKDHIIDTRLWKKVNENYILVFAQATQVK